MTTADRPMLRTSMRAARKAFVGALAPAVRRGLESALAAQVGPRLPPKGTLATYAAIGSEIDPSAIEQMGSHLTIAFPRVVRGEPLSFHAVPFTSLMPGARSIPEPPANAPAITPDMLLVPLLAGDRTGNRLGQGGGHYDRTLAALRAAGPVVAIGIAWDMQILDALAARAWDAPLDAIATPTTFHWCRAPAMRVP